MAVVRLLTAMVGERLWIEGELYPCDDATAARLIASGAAERAEVPSSAAAVLDPSAVERAVKAKPKGRTT